MIKDKLLTKNSYKEKAFRNKTNCFPEKETRLPPSWRKQNHHTLNTIAKQAYQRM
jgi:hypothetical protein